MAGSGKFWELCRFLEEHGFELLQLKPIEAPPQKPTRHLRGRVYLNECDAVFGLKQELALAKSPACALALFGFYVSYELYEEAAAFFGKIPGIEGLCSQAGVRASELRALLEA
jgi:hypothetical protein